ncbi:hypothetical protein H4218_001200 [Coemansia sp. IMI 209128]|nr:hypothetical protein H4218_001200 [Coemansia sp. IMI 209128]
MFATEYLRFLESANIAIIINGLWAMVTARNALALSTVCVFVVTSLALWNQPRRAMLVKWTVGHVLEAGFGTGDGSNGKPLLPRFIRRLFHSHLPQFDTRRDSGLGMEKADAEAVYQHNGTAPDTPPPPLQPPLLPLICSGSELIAGDPAGHVQHAGGGAKRRHRRHRGRKDIRSVATVSADRPMAKQVRRLMYRVMLVASRRHRPTDSKDVLDVESLQLPLSPISIEAAAVSEFATIDQAIEKAEEESAAADKFEVEEEEPVVMDDRAGEPLLTAAGPTHASVTDDDPVVDVTKPRRYRPAPIGQRNAGDTPPLPFYSLAPSAAGPLLGRMRTSSRPPNWPPQIDTDPEFSLFSSKFFS